MITNKGYRLSNSSLKCYGIFIQMLIYFVIAFSKKDQSMWSIILQLFCEEVILSKMCPLVIVVCKLILHMRHKVALCYHTVFPHVIKLEKFQCKNKTKYFFSWHLMSVVRKLHKAVVPGKGASPSVYRLHILIKARAHFRKWWECVLYILNFKCYFRDGSSYKLVME